MPDRDDNPDREKTRDELHQEAIARWKLSNDAFTDQRTRELDDLRFVDENEQWPDWAKAARGGTALPGVPPAPPRPMVTINKLLQPVDQLLAQERASKLSLEFVPEGSGATDDTADVYEDIVRARQHESRANLARRWAFERAGKAGLGWYRIDTVYTDVADITAENINDQDIVWRRILNQAAIYPDPSAQEPDFSDGEFLHETYDFPWAQYKRRWGTDDFQDGGASAVELVGIGDPIADWAAKTDDGKEWHTIRVSRYWYIEHQKRTRVVLSDGTLAWKDELPKDIPEGTILAEREVDDRSVSVCTVNAVRVVEELEWPGRYIPYVPVVGKEANVNGKRRWTGIVGPSKGAQHLFNFEASALIETVNAGTKAPWVAFKEQIEGFEDMWNQANTRNFPVLYANIVRDSTGSPLPLPQRNTAEPPIQAILATLHESDNFIKATTGFFDPSLGNLSPSDRSGKAIEALQRQGEIGSSGYVDNLATVSLPYEGKIVRDLLPLIYDRPGRVLPGIGADNERRLVMINQPHVMDAQQQPQPVPAGTPNAKTYDLKAGRYSVAATVGKQEATQRQAQAAMMGQIAEAAPQLVQFYADLWMKALGQKEIADRLHKMLPPPLQSNDGQPSPEQLMGQLNALTQQMQQMQQMLTQAKQIIDTEQIKTQGRLQEAQMENDTKIKLAMISSETQLQVADLKATAEAARTSVMAAHEQLGEIRAEIADMHKQHRLTAHEVASQAQEQQHEAAMTAVEQAHEVAMASHQAALQPETVPAEESV